MAPFGDYCSTRKPCTTNTLSRRAGIRYNAAIMKWVKKLPVLVLVLIMLILLCATFLVWNRSVLKSRILHHCISPQKSLETCYVAYYLNNAEENGVKHALQTLRERMVSDQTLRVNCHQASHAIGRTAFHEYGSIGKAYEEADYLCWGGYQHGVVEAMMRSKKSPEMNGELLRTACNEMKDGNNITFAYFSCIHGLGHALMYTLNNDLLNALVRCDELDNIWETRQCANGAFMENLLAGKSGHQSDFLPKDDMHFPCSAVREKDRDVCYQVQGGFILDHFSWNFKRAFLFCDELAASPLRIACAQGIGASVSNYAAYDPKKIATLCAIASTPLDQSCLYGALADLEGATGDLSLGTLVCMHQPQELQLTCMKIRDDAHRTFPGTINE